MTKHTKHHDCTRPPRNLPGDRTDSVESGMGALKVTVLQLRDAYTHICMNAFGVDLYRSRKSRFADLLRRLVAISCARANAELGSLNRGKTTSASLLPSTLRFTSAATPPVPITGPLRRTKKTWYRRALPVPRPLLEFVPHVVSASTPTFIGSSQCLSKWIYKYRRARNLLTSLSFMERIWKNTVT